MQVEWYEPTPRDKRRAEAFFATPAGKIALERYRRRVHIALEQQIRQGFIPPPEELAEHKKWMAEHPNPEVEQANEPPAPAPSKEEVDRRIETMHHLVLEYRIQKYNYTPTPDESAAHKKWMAEHPNILADSPVSGNIFTEPLSDFVNQPLEDKMNDFLKLIEERRSCRNFKSDMVPEETLNKILRAGTFAPTGMNRQSPVMIAVTNKELRDRLSRLNAEIMGTESDPFYGAPVVIIVLANRQAPTWVYDGSLVMGTLMLAAHACGVDSCWIHRAKEEFARPEGKKILQELGIEGDYEGIGHCVLGYAAAPLKSASPRKENYIYKIK